MPVSVLAQPKQPDARAHEDQVADWAYGAGFRGESLAMAIAIAHAESSLRINAVGDTDRTGGKWGPSIGLWQIRTLDAETGTGGYRDWNALIDNPERQARAAWHISGGGTTWKPWTTATNGSASRFLPQAREAGKLRELVGGVGAISGGGSATPGRPVPLGVSPDVFLDASPLPLAYQPPRPIAALAVAGLGGEVPLSEVFLGGEVDLTADEVGQLEFEVINRAFTLYGGPVPRLSIGATVHWAELVYEIASLEIFQGPSLPRVRIQARPSGVQFLRKSTSSSFAKRLSRKNSSPTEWAQDVANLAGLRFRGQGSPRRNDITPEKSLAGASFETAWDLLHRLAGELGFVVFESAGVLNFGTRRWLATTGVTVKVGWRSSWHDNRLDALSVPEIRESHDSDQGPTVRITLPRWRGEMVRPGMRLHLGGFTPGEFMVTRVRWRLDGRSPVDIDAVAPIDAAARGKVADELVTMAPNPSPQPSTGTPGEWLWPVSGRVSSEFGPRDGRQHKGIDIAAPLGRPIYASRAGTVRRSSVDPDGYGNYVDVDHGAGLTSRYAHLSRVLCRVGQYVERGNVIGEVGATGNARGYHLHFEIHVNGTAVNPRQHLPPQ